MNSANDTFSQVKHILKDVLDLDSNFLDSDENMQLIGNLPEFDSMAVVSVIAALEEQFNMIVEDDDIDADVFETIGSLSRFIEQKIN